MAASINRRRSRPVVAPATAQIHEDALLRVAQILGSADAPPLIAIGRTKFYALIASGQLPPPRKLGRTSVWRAGDVIDALRRL